MSMEISGLGQTAMPHSVSGASGGAWTSPQSKMSSLFAKIDGNNDGSISKSEFLQAFATQNPPKAFQAAGASSVWQALDPNNTGAVSKDDFVATMKQLMVSLRHHHDSDAGGSTSASATTSLASLLTQGSGGNTGGSSSGGSFYL